MGITIKEIAKISGYGIGTVSRALSEHPYLIKSETRAKILKIAKEHGYVKNIAAQALVMGESRDLGLMVPAIFVSIYYNDFFIKLISGIMEEVTKRGYRLRILLQKKEASFDEVNSEIRSLNLKGVILVKNYKGYFIKEEDLGRFDIPIIVVGEEYGQKNVTSLLLNNIEDGYKAGKYLIGLGHKDVGIIMFNHIDSKKRLKGFKKALVEEDIEFDAKNVVYSEGNIETGQAAAMRLLKKRKNITAIFALDDESAMGALNAIKIKGLNCPEDISVIGFNGIEMVRHTDPPLTTMVRPVSEMGKKAVELLIDEAKREEKRCFIFFTELHEGGSCGRI